VLEPGAFPRSPGLLVAAVLAVIGAWLLNFFTMALIGSLAFYLESSTAIFDLWLVAFMILSGYLVPLELFPAGLRGVANALPFRYTIAFPVEILTGMLRGEAVLRELAIQWAYVVGCGAAAILAFRAGVRRFSAFGG
jgi:ABC-2 type transport system permease protein